MTFLHGSAGNCGFTTTFYKAAGLINGQKLTSNGVFGLISASKLPWIRKTNILRLVTKYIFQLQININLEN